MKPQVIALTVLALGTGMAGGLVMAPSAPSDTAAPGDLDAAGMAGIRAELADLRRQNEDLLRAVQAIAPTVAAADSSPADVVATETIGEPKRLEVVGDTPRETDSQQLPSDFGEQLRAAVTEYREQEKQERREDREEKLENRIEKRLARVAEELGLTPYQADQLEQTLRQQREDIEAIRDKYRDVEDEAGRKAEIDAVRAQTQTALAQVLSAEQLQQYEENYSGRKSILDRAKKRRGGGGKKKGG